MHWWKRIREYTKERGIYEDRADLGEKDHVVYGLIDPRDGRIYYVGKTNNLDRRVREHNYRYQANRIKQSWLKSLEEDGVEPCVCVLGLIDKRYARGLERYWIRKGRENGWPLLNYGSR